MRGDWSLQGSDIYCCRTIEVMPYFRVEVRQKMDDTDAAGYASHSARRVTARALSMH